MFPENRYQVLALGAGFGGLLHAVRMVQAGIRPENIRIVDTAGVFGGTWYYNRYPGIACDIESYGYLPLLEEMGYMPKHKYSSGAEIRNYANQVAARLALIKARFFRLRRRSWSGMRRLRSGKWNWCRSVMGRSRRR